MDANSARAPLGQLVLERGWLSEEQVELALAEHLATGKRLGDVLVDHGWLTEEQIEELLHAQAAADGARGIELLKTSVAEAEAELVPGQPEPEDAHPGHLLFVWTSSGYALLNRAGEPPAVGSEVGVSGGSRVVTKIGPSPLPGDPRLCAFLDVR